MRQHPKLNAKEIWDQRAEADAPFFISGDANVDIADYLADGRRHAFDLTADFFREQGFEPQAKRMLDIGCGIGRHAAGFAEMFSEVVGIDASEEMIARARQLNRSLSNVQLLVNNGSDLSAFPDEHFDFVFSHWVFPHIRERAIVERYIGEIRRVLRVGGLMKVVLARKGFVPIFGIAPIPRWLVDRTPRRLLALYASFDSILRKNPAILTYVRRTCLVWLSQKQKSVIW